MKTTCALIALLLPAAASAADPPAAERGRAVYQTWCMPCHGTGLGKPGTAAAAGHGVKTPVLEDRQDLTPKTIETAVRKGVDIMPRFRKTEISDSDLAAIVAYLTHK
jgi:mono/diheme cytochrome c family protein